VKQKTIGRASFVPILIVVGGVNYGEMVGINVPLVDEYSMQGYVIPILRTTTVIGLEGIMEMRRQSEQ